MRVFPSSPVIEQSAVHVRCTCGMGHAARGMRHAASAHRRRSAADQHVVTLTAPAAETRPLPETPSAAQRRARWPRIALLVLLVLAGAAVVPSVLPFTVETVDNDRVCVPIAEGWKAERAKPSEADMQELVDILAILPSPDAMRDPVQRAAWLEAERVRTSTPGYKRAEAYLNWVGGPGACIPESRHRLILTGAGLGGVLALATLRLVAAGRLTSSRSSE